MKKIAIAALAACATLWLTAAPATAHKVKFATGTAMQYYEPTDEVPTHDLIGIVTSRRQACEPRRKVVLFHNGNRMAKTTSTRVPEVDGGADAFYAYTSGEAEPPPGTYRTRVQRRVLRRTARHRHVCRSARSNPVIVAAAEAQARSLGPLTGPFYASPPTPRR